MIDCLEKGFVIGVSPLERARIKRSSSDTADASADDLEFTHAYRCLKSQETRSSALGCISLEANE